MTGGGADPGLSALSWLGHHVRHRPDATAVTCRQQGEIRSRLSFRELGDLVGRVAAAMSGNGVRAGDRVLLVLPNDDSFPVTLLAVAALGAVAVPGPTPATGRERAFQERLSGIAEDCRPALVVVASSWERELPAAPGRPGAPWTVRSWEELSAPGGGVAPAGHEGAPSDCAFIQYTSGSTSRPKGVMISHRALRASCAQAARVYGERPDDTAVTWVPLHHDMGLVTGVLRPLFSGYESVLLSPREFVRAPGSWLSAITASGGTLSSAPDFAYDLCVRRIPEAEAGSFDLGSWRVARSAGEVVRADTADRFAARFAAAGFRADGFCPSYGMAEATLTVTTSTPELPPLRLPVRQDDLRQGHVVPVDEHGGDDVPTVRLLSSGAPLPGTRVEIRNAAAGQLGDVFIQGPQLFSGYWSGRAGGGGGVDAWHATGDRGFLHDGQLFVVGRADEVLVHHGLKFYPADILAVCARIPGLRPGRCAAFTVRTPTDAAEADRICLVAELAAAPAGPLAELGRLVQRRLVREIGLYVAQVAFLPAGELPVTTSGKVRVTETGRRFALGSLPLL